MHFCFHFVFHIVHTILYSLETVRVSHWPITWRIYLPCTVAQGESHCASNIISNSHPFYFKWVDLPIPEIQQFQYFTFKIQGQGHGWGQSLKSQHGSNILLTHIPFIPCQSAIPFLRYSNFKIWPWISKVKVMGEVNVESHNIGHPNPKNDFFKIWPWKSKVKVMVEVKVESHKVGVTSYRLTSLLFNVNQPSHPEIKHFHKVKVMGEVNVESHNMGPTFYWLTSLSFHANQPSHFWDTTFSRLTLKIQGQGHGRGERWKSQHGSNILSDSHPFRSMSIGHPNLKIRLFQNLTLKIQGQGHGWGQSWKSQSGCNILSTHIPFVQCQ